MTHDAGGEDLERWARDGYARAYRTAFMIVRNRADAEEAVQEAFLRAWRFRASLPEGAGRDPWLYRVLVNACHSKLRHEIPRRNRSVALVDGADHAIRAGAAPAADAQIDQLEARHSIAAALAQLPEHLRTVVVLRYWTGLSEREIATAIQRRPGTVKSRLAEARRRLALDPHLAGLAADVASQGDDR